MTVPLAVLAVFAVVLGFLGTPAWPWFEGYLAGHAPAVEFGRLQAALPLMAVSTVVVVGGIGLGWRLYGRNPRRVAETADVLEVRFPAGYRALEARLWFDEVYAATVVRAHAALAVTGAIVDRMVIGGLVTLVGWLVSGLAWVAKWVDELFVNAGFDAGCETTRGIGRLLSRLQGGRPQRHLALLGLGMACLAVAVIWGWGGSR